MLFILSSILLSPVESIFLNTSTGFISTVIKLGIIFIFVGLITSSIMYLVSDSTRRLFDRVFNLIKRKIGK